MKKRFKIHCNCCPWEKVTSRPPSRPVCRNCGQKLTSLQISEIIEVPVITPAPPVGTSPSKSYFADTGKPIY